jgi:ABC-type transporter Mla MlaB component
VPSATQFQLETNGSAATLYISEALLVDHLEALREACAALPPRVRTLRLDLNGVRRLGEERMSTLRALMREWRALRGGECRLSFHTENLVLTYTEREALSGPGQSPWSIAPVASDAMTAAYL